LQDNFEKEKKSLLNFFEKKDYLSAGKKLEKLIKLNNTDPFLFNFKGILESIANNNNAAITFFEKATELDPNFYNAHYNLGMIQRKLKLYDESIFSFKSALDIKKDYYDCILALGLSYLDKINFFDAIKANDECIKIDPKRIDAYLNNATVYYRKGEFKISIDLNKKVLSMYSNSFGAYNNLGLSYFALSNFNSSIYSFKKALEINSKYLEAYGNYAFSLSLLKRFDEALEIIDQALQIDENFCQGIQVKSNILFEKGEVEESMKLLEKCLSIDPKYSKAITSLIRLKIFLFENEEAYKLTKKYSFDLTDLYELQGIIFNCKYFFDDSGEIYKTLIQKFRDENKNYIRKLFSEKNNIININKIKIGFISGDFFGHAVSSCVESFLKELSKKNYIEVYIFHNKFENNKKKDDFEIFNEESFKNNFTYWMDIEKLTDEEVAILIKNLDIHILIDLSGHTDKNRLTVFCYRPCRIQITWLGWLGSTGIDEMDYIIVDPYVIDESKKITKEYFSEKKLALDFCWTPYSNPSENIHINKSSPCLSKNFVTLGSFNNNFKLNKKILTLWATILNRTGNCKLYIKTGGGGKYMQFVERKIRSIFQESNISEEKFFIDTSFIKNKKDYFEKYNEIDICLDTYPYPGCTTSLDAIYMHVPILTLVGNSFLSRSTYSLNKNLQLDYLNCISEKDFIDKALYLVSDFKNIQNIKDTLIENKRNSVIFNIEKFTNGFLEKIQPVLKNHNLIFTK